MEYMIDFVEAKYHLAVAKRMLASYEEYPEKRFLVGVVNELARAVRRLVRAFLICGNVSGDFRKFLSIAPRYLDDVTIGNLMRVLEVEKEQKVSPVEFLKNEKIILLIGGKYRVLTIGRIREFIDSVDLGIKRFRQI